MKHITLLLFLVLLNSLSMAASQIDIDIKQHEYVQALQEERWEDSIRLLNELRAMEVDVGVEAIFFEGRAYYELGNYIKAENRFRQYGELAGSGGANYSQVINYLSGIAKKKQQQQAEEQKIREEEQLLQQANVFGCDYCPQMTLIPAGSFQMGTTDKRNFPDFKRSRPVHTVHIKRFALGIYEVSNAQFQVFLNATGYRLKKRNSKFLNPDHPVVGVNWDDAKAYVDWLSKQANRPYRLPTEAEWEYAYKAKTTTDWFFGEDVKDSCTYANVGEQANGRKDGWWSGDGSYGYACNDGYKGGTSPVGSFKPNPWGLYDMLGNAEEWVEDCWHENYNGAPIDGSAWIDTPCTHHVIRGGSWNESAYPNRSHSREKANSADPRLTGFRVAQTLKPN